VRDALTIPGRRIAARIELRCYAAMAGRLRYILVQRGFSRPIVEIHPRLLSALPVLVSRDVFLEFVRVQLLHHAREGPIYGLQVIEEPGQQGYSLSPMKAGSWRYRGCCPAASAGAPVAALSSSAADAIDPLHRGPIP